MLQLNHGNLNALFFKIHLLKNNVLLSIYILSYFFIYNTYLGNFMLQIYNEILWNYLYLLICIIVDVL